LIRTRHALLILLATAALAAPALGDGLRVVTWNITNYSGGRNAAFETAVYGEFEGRSMSPDIIAAQELLSQAGVNALLSILNNAPGSPGDWAAANFINGNDTDNGFFYRTSRVTFLGQTVVSVGSGAPNHPRDINRYDVRLAGYDSDEAVVAVYSVHMKAGNGSDDQARRLVEAQNIRDDAESLPEGWSFLLAGDFNIQSSNQSAYTELVGPQANNDGRFFDPISRPGSWQNSSVFRYIHTQDPTGAGGMDDRYDQILISSSLTDDEGMSYIGSVGTPFSNVTWNDPNHSYRCWGNDGTSYNNALTVTGNTMVGPVVAQALKNTTGGQAGHLPVLLDLRVPASIDAPALIDFGFVPVGPPTSRSLHVTNDADTLIWGPDGADELDYTLLPSPEVNAPAGAFSLDAGQTGAHDITVQSASVGPLSGLVIVTSDDPDQPDLTVEIIAEFVVTCSPADVAPPFGALDFSDIVGFLTAFAEQAPQADLAEPFGSFDFSDVVAYLTAFGAGCP